MTDGRSREGVRGGRQHGRHSCAPTLTARRHARQSSRVRERAPRQVTRCSRRWVRCVVVASGAALRRATGAESRMAVTRRGMAAPVRGVGSGQGSPSVSARSPGSWLGLVSGVALSQRSLKSWTSRSNSPSSVARRRWMSGGDCSARLMRLRARRIWSSARQRVWSSPADETRTWIASVPSSAMTCLSGSSMRMQMRQPSRGACAQERGDPGLGCEIGDDDLDPLDGRAEELGGLGRGGIRRVRVARDHVVGLVCRRLERTGCSRGGSGVGPEHVLGRVERARDQGAVPRIRGATREPTPHGLGVDLNGVGELVERQAGAGQRGPQLLVLQGRLHLPERCRFPALPV